MSASRGGRGRSMGCDRSDGGASAGGLHDFAIVGDVRERNNNAAVNGVGGAPRSPRGER